MTIIMDRNLISISKSAYWSHSIAHTGKNIMSTTFDFIRSLFRTSSPVAAGGNASDLLALYQLSRGRDSVSPAVLRKLADAAAK